MRTTGSLERAYEWTESGLKILVAKRTSTSAAFGAPLPIDGIAGLLAEGPALSADGHSLYFHKKVGSAFGIYRVTR